MTDAFEQLTPSQRAQFCNGCGGKGGLARPLHWWGLEADCDRHDWAYTLGGTEEDRLKADNALREAILARCATAPWWKRWYYRAQAYDYYKAVREFGKPFFSFREKPWIPEEAVASLNAKESHP